MIDIAVVRGYYADSRVFFSDHALKRLRQRKIGQADIRKCVMTGEIIEQYPDDFPFPSCLICGDDINGEPLHVVISDEGTMSRVITAYRPNTEKFETDLKTRKEKNNEMS